MKINTKKLTVPILTFSLFPAALLAAPVEFDGHFYEVISDPGISWDDANEEATGSTFMGVTGHLATITSEAEDAFIDELRIEAELESPEAWVGGFQDEECEPEPGCGWQWVNGEGAISTPDVPLLSYSNWLGPEPNDLGGERFIGVGLGNAFGWNDERALGNIGGYVVEYDTEVPLGDCLGNNSCPTNAGQTLSFPEETQAPMGAELGVNSFEFTDDPARCGVDQLVLFDDDGIADNELVIPAYLCGSPNFMVVAVDSTDIDVPDGTIFVENEVTAVLPDNLYECDGPINPVPDPDLDPQHRDVVAWQTTNPADMLESELGLAAGYPGGLAEVTFECGSSRGRVKSASYYVIGMHIDFGPGFEFETNAAGNRQAFIALTGYKLQLLERSVRDSAVALGRSDVRTLRTLLRVAVRYHGLNDFANALATLQQFDISVQNANYALILGENFRGEALMRSGNIQFMYTDKIN